MSGHACSHFVLRAVPHPYTGEGTPVGVVLQARTADFLDLRVILDGERLRRLVPDADVELLERYLRAYAWIASGDERGGEIALLSRPERFHWLAAPRSDVLQPSPVDRSVAPDPARLLDELFEERVLARIGQT